MAHITTDAVNQLAVDAKKLVKRVPPDMRTELEHNLKILTEFPDIDPGQTREGRQTERARNQRDEAAANVWALLDQYDDWESQQPIDHGQIVARTQVGNPTPEGDRLERITYADGAVEEFVAIPAAQAAEMEATMKRRVDAIYDAKADLHQADQLRSLAAQTDGDEFSDRAKAVHQRGRDALNTVRDELVEELRGKGFSEPEIADELRKRWELHYEPVHSGVREGLELARQGKANELYTHIVNLSPPAKRQLVEKLDTPELREVSEQLTEIESELREEAARLARAGGLI